MTGQLVLSVLGDRRERPGAELIDAIAPKVTPPPLHSNPNHLPWLSIASQCGAGVTTMIIVTLLARKVFQMSPTANPADQNPDISASAAWGLFVEQAARFRGSSDHALGLGLDPRLLLSYAGGRCSVSERTHVEGILPRSTWAARAVISLVKAARDPKSRAAQLINTVASLDSHSDEEVCQLIERSCSP